MSEEVGESNLGLLAIAQSVGVRSKRVQQAVAAHSAGMMAYRAYTTLQSKRKERNRYYVTVEESDPVYDLIHTWLLDQITSEDRKALIVRTPRGHDRHFVDEEDAPKTLPELGVFYDSHRSQIIVIEGHQVEITKDNRAGAPDRKQHSSVQSFPTQAFTFGVLGTEGRDAVIRLLTRISDEHHKQPTRTGRLFVSTEWGSWRRRTDLPLRKLSTVIMPEGVIPNLVDDLTQFLADEDRYVNLGLPWHRGYLFHGPPGTGKTSLAKALAAHFSVDIYAMSIPSIRNDNDLGELMGYIKPRSILLLEDIDVSRSARHRPGDDEPENKGITTAGLLNALDGFATPHGLITVMTTNNRDALDSALIRPGRIDRKICVDHLVQEQAERLAGMVVGKPFITLPTIQDGISAAELVEQAKTLLHDPKAAEEALLAFAESRRA